MPVSDSEWARIEKYVVESYLTRRSVRLVTSRNAAPTERQRFEARALENEPAERRRHHQPAAQAMLYTP